MRSDVARRARWITGAVATAGSALHGAAMSAGFGTSQPFGSAMCGAVSAGALTALLFALVQRTTNRVKAAVSTLAGATVGGALYLWLSAVLLHLTGTFHFADAIFGVALFGGMMGLFIGAFCGIALSVPAVLSAWAARAPSHGSLPWLGLAHGVWLGIVALCVPWDAFSPDASPTMTGTIAFVVVLGFGMAAVSGIHLAYRAHWLGRVRSDRTPGYAIVPAATMPDECDVLPWDQFSRNDALLVRERVAAGGAYRGVVSHEPIALVTATVAR